MLPGGLFENGYFDIDAFAGNEDLTMYMNEMEEVKQYTELSKQNPAVLVESIESHNYTGYPQDNLHSHHHDSVSSIDSPVSEMTSDLPADYEEATWRADDPDWLSYSTTNTPTEQQVLTNNTQHLTVQTTNTYSQRKSRGTKRKSSTKPIELEIEFDENSKRTKRITAPLTEQQKRIRRKELNRLAAQRCRTKRRGHAEILEDEIKELAEKNQELKKNLEQLTETKDQLYDIIKFHFQGCRHGDNSIQADSIAKIVDNL